MDNDAFTLQAIAFPRVARRTNTRWKNYAVVSRCETRFCTLYSGDKMVVGGTASVSVSISRIMDSFYL
jgi:phage protein U